MEEAGREGKAWSLKTVMKSGDGPSLQWLCSLAYRVGIATDSLNKTMDRSANTRFLLTTTVGKIPSLTISCLQNPYLQIMPTLDLCCFLEPGQDVKAAVIEKLN